MKTVRTVPPSPEAADRPAPMLQILDPHATVEYTPAGPILTLPSLPTRSLESLFSTLAGILVHDEGFPAREAETLAELAVEAIGRRLLADALAGIIRRV